MFRRLLIALLVLALLFTAYLFWQAGNSRKKAPSDKQATSVAGTVAPEDLQTIAFGSCNRQDLPQTYWPIIAQHQPEAWIWLGDNIYGDTDDAAALADKYDQQKTAPPYQAFRAATQIYGTWDDHDYGDNDAGKEWRIKEAAEELLLDFLDVPAGAPVRQYPGVYQSYNLGPADKRVKLILLDTRYFRDELAPSKTDNQRYQTNETGDILGEAQWDWLEQELQDSTAVVHIIGSSIQFLPAEHAYEKWSNFPAAKQRMLDLLTKLQPANTVLLSGDRHLAEMSHLLLDETYGIYEVTSSGLTHSYEKANESNAQRVGPLIGQKNYGLITINWEQPGAPSIRLQIRSVEDDNVFHELIIGPLADIAPSAVAEKFTSNIAMPNVLKPCPDSPNCVSTQSAQPKKKREPLSFSGSSASALENLKGIIAAFPRAKLVKEEPNYLHYEFKTWPIPFVDDVEFLFDEEQGQIHYRSASRVGYSDLGVNGKRMAKIAQRWSGLD